MKPDDVTKIFLKRHSCRSYSEDEISTKDIGIVARAGLSAPCGLGIHASHLFVFRKGEEGYRKLTDIAMKCTGREAFYGAPVIIIETVDESAKTPLRDGAAVIENMLLAASMLDIGACWIHAPSVIFSGEGRKLLKKIDIPENYQVIDSIVLGRKAMELSKKQ